MADEQSVVEQQPPPEQSGWLNRNLVPILAVVVVIGGGAMLLLSKDNDVKFSVISAITLVLSYYFGKSSNDWRKDSTINKLSDKVNPSRDQ